MSKVLCLFCEGRGEGVQMLKNKAHITFDIINVDDNKNCHREKAQIRKDDCVFGICWDMRGEVTHGFPPGGIGPSGGLSAGCAGSNGGR